MQRAVSVHAIGAAPASEPFEAARLGRSQRASVSVATMAATSRAGVALTTGDTNGRTMGEAAMAAPAIHTDLRHRD